MAARAEFVEAARSMTGTPYAHQGRQPRRGVDCIGLLICAAWMVDIDLIDHTTYGRNPNPKQLMEKFEMNRMRMLDMSERTLPGDLLLFWNRESAGPQHLALAGDGPNGSLSMIHTSNDLKRVVENPFAAPWTQKLHSRWLLEDLT